MKNAQRAAAARMLKRAQALGLVSKTGEPPVIDLMEELMAAAAGFRNAHAWRASLVKEKADVEAPALEQVNPAESGSDYRLVNGRGCWVEINGYLAHLYLEPDDSALSVDLHVKVDAFHPLASASLSQDEVDAAQGRAEEAMQKRLEALGHLGVAVRQDCEGLWTWTSPSDESEFGYSDKERAVEDAWEVVGRSVCGMNDWTEPVWRGLSLDAQCNWVAKLADT